MKRHEPKHKMQLDQRSGKWTARLHGRYYSFTENETQSKKMLCKEEADLYSGNIVIRKGKVISDNSSSGTTDLRIEELCVKHLEAYKTTGINPKTYKLREDYLLKFCKYVTTVGKGNMVSEIDTELVRNYLEWVKPECRSNNGGIEHKRHLKAMFKWATEEEACIVNIKKFPKLKYHQPISNPLSNEEKSQLNQLSEDVRDAIIYEASTGLRPSELININEKEDVIEILDGKETKYMVTVNKHKTADSARSYHRRTVPLNDTAFEIFKRQSRKHPNSPYLFVNGDGNKYSDSHSYNLRISRASKKLGIKLNPYRLRHTFGYDLGNKNENLKHIADLMGHTNIRTTTRYQANSDKAHIAAVDKISDGWKSILTKPRTKKMSIPKKLKKAS